MQDTKISIIVTCFNHEKYITTAIESIIAQTYKNWELFVVDDGSIDNSQKKIIIYAEKYDNIHFLHHENFANKKLRKTLELGLNSVNDEYIAFLEGDDYWENTYLEEKIKIINDNPGISILFNEINLVGDEKKVAERLEYTNVNKENWYKNIGFIFLKKNIIPTFSCVLIKKSKLLECDFNTPFDAYLDWWLWVQICCQNKAYFLTKKLTNWRQHKESYSHNINVPKNFYIQIIKLFQKTYAFSRLSLYKRLLMYLYILNLRLSLNKKLDKILRSLFRTIDDSLFSLLS